MNKSSYNKQTYTAIALYQLLFWILIIISSIALKSVKQDLIMDLNSIFSKEFFLNSGKFLSFFVAWGFIFIYYHCFSISINKMHSSFFYLIIDNKKKLLDPQILMIIIITFLIFYLTLSELYIHSLAVTITLLILHLINIFLLYCTLKELMGKFFTPAILLYSSVFFMAMVYFYLHVSDFQQMKFIVSLVNFTFFFTFMFFIYLFLMLTAIYILYSIARAEYSSATFGKEILENELKLKELKSCKIPYIDGKTYKPKDLLSIFKQLEKACTRSNYTVAITTILKKNIIPDSFRDSVLNTFNSIHIPKKELQKQKTFYIHFRNKVNLYNSLITAISTILLIIIYTFTSIIEISYMKSLLFIIYIFIFLRLLSRSTEICISFYQDIIAKKSLKNTLLTGTDRISLAIKSIVEIIFTVATLSIIKSLYGTDLLNTLREQHDFAQLLKLIIFSFSNSIATSLFNISFPGDTHNITLLTLSQHLIHIMQVITSLTLITLSIANYINLPKYSFYYELRKTNTELILYKVFYTNNTSYEKLILSAHSIDSLSFILYSSWQNGTLTDTDYLEIEEFLNDNKNK
ncbi:hypothetical protein FOC88_21265 [Bacillus thuringiensis]|uniref:hypothetical protein n=1 Tax=Bacillus cereus group TaxID=86661 RepID=UPI0005A30550|nr:MULTISPECIES: hypothetical protein [Bacillus cereus group]AJH82051.1 putative membrane protein [Bacillus thuringiensis]KAA0754378.1 hypothetical protein DN397_00180 [Bacillus sp. AY1-10]QKI20081.1 hypothetical protein FOC88_21265 [Bacillus thuringiensis]HDR7532955.1 hypothetical protein [Bacillus anthracis]